MKKSASDWFDKWLGTLVFGGLFGGLITFFVVLGIIDHLETKAHEARCLQARAEIFYCLEHGKDGDSAWLNCTERAKFKHMCTRWPRSWEGR